MSWNQRGLYDRDNRYAFSGKDASIFDGDGQLLSTIETFQAQVNFTNAQYQPLGSPIQQEFMAGYAVTIAATNFVVQSDDFQRQIFDFFVNGRHAPMWTISSVIHGYDGSEEQVNFFDCVPTGQWDIVNLTVGDILRRTLNFHVNQPPDLQKLLTIPS